MVIYNPANPFDLRTKCDFLSSNPGCWLLNFQPFSASDVAAAVRALTVI